MALRGSFVLLLLLGSQGKTSATMLNGDGKTVNDVAIFYSASDEYLRNIVQHLEDMFLANRPRNNNVPKDISEVYVNPLPLDTDKITLSEGSISDVWNISTQIVGAIFVDVNSDSLFLSSFLEGLAIPAIGIFQIKGQPRTQVIR